jgi:cytochrome c5
VRALWCLHVIGALDHAVLAHAAQHPSDVVRGWAVQLATEKASAIEALPVAPWPSSPPQTPRRWCAWRSLRPCRCCSGDDAVGSVAMPLAAHGEDANDRFLPKMLWFGVARAFGQDFAKCPRAGRQDPAAHPRRLHPLVRRHAGPRAATQLVADRTAWMTPAPQGPARSSPSHSRTRPPCRCPRAGRRCKTHLDEHGSLPRPRQLADQLAVQFGDQAGARPHARESSATRRRPSPTGVPPSSCSSAAATPRPPRCSSPCSIWNAYRSEVIPLLARSGDPGDPRRRCSSAMPPSTRPIARRAQHPDRAPSSPPLCSRRDPGWQLRQEAARCAAHPAAAQPQRCRTSTASSTSPGARSRILGLGQDHHRQAQEGLCGGPSGAFSARHGKEVFQRTCTICHSINGVGGKIGPDLGGSWRNGVDYFLENIIDPNAVVGEDYQLHVDHQDRRLGGPPACSRRRPTPRWSSSRSAERRRWPRARSRIAPEAGAVDDAGPGLLGVDAREGCARAAQVPDQQELIRRRIGQAGQGGGRSLRGRRRVRRARPQRASPGLPARDRIAIGMRLACQRGALDRSLHDRLCQVGRSWRTSATARAVSRSGHACRILRPRPRTGD